MPAHACRLGRSDGCAPHVAAATHDTPRTVQPVIVMPIQYWPGGDPTDTTHLGWAAAIRLHPADGEQWLAVAVLAGRRHAWRVTGPDTHLPVLLASLVQLAPAGPVIVGAAPVDRAAIVNITSAVEAALAGTPSQPGPPPGGQPIQIPNTPGQRAGAHQRALAVDQLTEAQVADLLPGTRDHPAIIRGLRKAGVLIALRHQGRRYYPAFQFAGPRVHPVAAHINLLLSADRQPWATAAWWATVDPILGTRPVDLLDKPQQLDRLLTRASCTPPSR